MVCQAVEIFPSSLPLVSLGLGCGNKNVFFWSLLRLLARMLGVPCLRRAAAAGDEVAQAAKRVLDLILGVSDWNVFGRCSVPPLGALQSEKGIRSMAFPRSGACHSTLAAASARRSSRLSLQGRSTPQR